MRRVMIMEVILCRRYFAALDCTLCTYMALPSTFSQTFLPHQIL